MNEETWTPLIISAKFSPNPVEVGNNLLISVFIVDGLVDEKETVRYANEFYAGEV